MLTKPVPLLDSRRYLAALFGVLVVATLVALHEVALRWIAGRSGPGALPSSYVLLAFWGVAAPTIIRSATRWPIGKSSDWRAVVRHALHAAAFIVATNLLVRIPRLWLEPAFSVDQLLSSTMSGVVVYGPGATLVYALLVAVGHLVLPGTTDSGPGSSHTAPVGAPDVVAEDEEPEAPSASTCIPIRDGDVHRSVPIEEIEWIEADDNYVKVAATGRVHRIRMRMSEIEARLPTHAFVRVHRSVIVPVERVRRIVPRIHGDWIVEVASGREFAVARGRRRELEARLALAAKERAIGAD